MSVADKLLEVANGLVLVFEAGENKHKMRYATSLGTGDGTNEISFDCPFEPDAVTVTTHGADAMYAADSVRQMSFDFRSFARYGGIYLIRQSGANINGNFTSATGKNYFRWANGTCTAMVPQSLNAGYIGGVPYICTAVKYTDKSDKALLEEEILSLAETGEILQYSKARVNATLGDEEWQSLIAKKPKRTFTLI